MECAKGAAQVHLGCSIQYLRFICRSEGESFCKGAAGRHSSELHTNDSPLCPPHSIVILHSTHALMLSHCSDDGRLGDGGQVGGRGGDTQQPSWWHLWSPDFCLKLSFLLWWQRDQVNRVSRGAFCVPHPDILTRHKHSPNRG